VPTISTDGIFIGDIHPTPTIATSHRSRLIRNQLITKSACCNYGAAFAFYPENNEL
jgi:hypothetical protein